MKSISRISLVMIFVGTVGVGCAHAGKPTLSLVASGLNFEKLQGGTKAEIHVLPGDRFTTELTMRDWSPNGEKLIAYQAMIEQSGFTTGPKGFVEPVVYSEAQRKEFDNSPNVFVDKTRPDYVYKDMHCVALVDSRSEGYRWMGVMLDGEGPVCPEAGKNFYGGTLHMMVSDNAAGTFTLSLKEGEDFSTLLKPPGPKIGEIDLENLKVHVSRPTDAGFWPGMIERLNSHWFKTAQPEGHELQDVRKAPRIASLLGRLNESRRIVEKPADKNSETPVEKKE